MTGKYDCAVVGGGVAGLMTAARLSEQGRTVALVERDLLGSGATTGNHGMIHSGALYARWHPEVVPACLEAQTAYRCSFAKCIADTETCWYVGKPATLYEYEKLWRRYDMDHREVDPRQVRELVDVPNATAVQATAVRELIIDTHALITDLAARCAANGVELAVGASASRVVTENDSVRGVETARGFIAASNVVLCSGIGTRDLLERSQSVVAEELKSRLEMMMAFPGELPCAVIGLEFGWPALAPALASGSVLASRYGAPQRWVRGRARWPVPAAEAAELSRELAEWLWPGLLDCSAGVAWVCSKTEHCRGSSDQWGTEPNYAVIDHGDRDSIAGWWTVLPGKMTLALHASRDVVTAVTGTKQPLALPVRHAGNIGDVAELVTVTPWTAHQEATAR